MCIGFTYSQRNTVSQNMLHFHIFLLRNLSFLATIVSFEIALNKRFMKDVQIEIFKIAPAYLYILADNIKHEKVL